MKSQISKGLFVLTGFILFFCFLFTDCQVKKEPDKIWNLRAKIRQLALDLVGVPYQFGGDDITGFDCSGFVSYVYSAFGLDIPRTAKKQGKLKQTIKFKNAESGDILVFKLEKGWHSGIYIGENIFIHAPSRFSNVKKENLNYYWKSRLKKIIQLIHD
ncbi:MAG: C40 family peptidase [Candidatus Aminicenantes bacterium]|nr:C40 family peptidase [Candidatus Aminicenantes bacterium]